MLKYFLIKEKKVMKLYRALDFDDSRSLLSEHNFKIGLYNEALNLIKAKAFSPSLSYLQQFPRNFEWEDSTFYYPNQMVKFFYPSLIDACTWCSYGNFIVCEIDLPVEECQKYFGVGFYDKNKMELCIPYEDLYRLAAQEQLPSFKEILSLYEMIEPTYYKKVRKNFNKKLIAPNLTVSNSSPLYPYLCFLSKINFSILYLTYNDDFTHYALKAESERSVAFANELMKNSQPNYPFLMHEGLSFIEEENKIAKRILSQSGKSFIPKL